MRLRTVTTVLVTVVCCLVVQKLVFEPSPSYDVGAVEMALAKDAAALEAGRVVIEELSQALLRATKESPRFR